MPGFVDVTNWTSEQVRRLGHADDADDPRDSNHSHRNLARRNPYGYGKNREQAVSEKYPVAWVWAAAVMAHDINNGYLKTDVHEWDEDQQINRKVKSRNRDVMMQYLKHPQDFDAAAIARGQEVQNFLRNDLTFRALKGKITEFDQAVSRALAVESAFDSVLHRFEMAIVASLPASAARAQKRATADERVAFARGGLIAQPGAKISTQVEVLSAVYSQNYNCWFIKGITDQDQPVFFSHKEAHDAGTWLSIRGMVKAHRDNLTQLNRVKVL